MKTDELYLFRVTDEGPLFRRGAIVEGCGPAALPFYVDGKKKREIPLSGSIALHVPDRRDLLKWGRDFKRRNPDRELGNLFGSHYTGLEPLTAAARAMRAEIRADDLTFRRRIRAEDADRRRRARRSRTERRWK